jgi:hypothetical protein
MKQFCVTTAMGKRLIGRGMVQQPDVQRVLKGGTLVVIAGTTNGYVAEEILRELGQEEGFSREGFRRGMVVPPGVQAPEYDFPGDVVIRDGIWQRGQTISDVADDLKPGDVVLKGGNAFDAWGQAAVFVAHPQGGTVLASVTAVIGRRARLIVPIGLEKRVFEDVHVLAKASNAPGAEGPRLCPMPGDVFTELDAIGLLTGAEAWLIGGGGVYGAEGAVWLGIDGDGEEVRAATGLIQSVASEPPCQV